MERKVSKVGFQFKSPKDMSGNQSVVFDSSDYQRSPDMMSIIKAKRDQEESLRQARLAELDKRFLNLRGIDTADAAPINQMEPSMSRAPIGIPGMTPPSISDDVMGPMEAIGPQSPPRRQISNSSMGLNSPAVAPKNDAPNYDDVMGMRVSQEDRDAAASEKRLANLWGGIGDSLGNAQGWGNFILGKMNPHRDTAKNMAKQVGAAADQGIADKDAAFKQKMEEPELRSKLAMSDATSKESKIAQESVKGLIETIGKAAPKYADALKGLETASANQIREIVEKNPLLKQTMDYLEKEQSNKRMLEIFDIKSRTKEGDVVNKDVQKLSDKIGNTQGLTDALANVEAKLGFSLDDAQIGKGGELVVGGKSVDLPGASVPGLGRVSGYSGDARQLQSAIAKVFNTELKDRSGAAVTNPEMARMREEFATGKFNTEAEMIQALKDYRHTVASELKNREAGFSPQAVEKYRSRGGKTSADIPSGKSPLDVNDPKVKKAMAAGYSEEEIRKHLGR